jgi:hypothetical protein
MSNWTERKLIAFPISLLAAANHLAHILDPDTGGSQTYSPDRVRGDYIFAEIPFIVDFWPAVERRDPDEWAVIVNQLAESRGREPMPEETIRALCSAMLIGDEVPTEEML